MKVRQHLLQLMATIVACGIEIEEGYASRVDSPRQPEGGVVAAPLRHNTAEQYAEPDADIP